MKQIPDAVFIIDVAKEDIAVKEAFKLNIPIIALVDTDGDPTPIEHVIPGNDDAIRSIQLATSLVADNYIYGSQLRLVKLADLAKQQELEKAQKQKISSGKEKNTANANVEKPQQKQTGKVSEKKKTTETKEIKEKQTKIVSEKKKTTETKES